MQPIQSISIPQPCHENWNQMTPVEQGRHCMQCNKTVTNFTAMTNTEIINYFAGYGNVCGRFDTQQLNALNNYLDRQETTRFSWKKLALAAVLTSLFTTAQAQNERTVGKVAITQPAIIFKNKLVGDSITYITVKGKVISDDDNGALAGVSVNIKGTNQGTMTNADGDFSLRVSSTAQTLSMSFIGYETYDASIVTFANQSNCFTLKMRSVMLGGAIVVVRKVPFYKVWWYKFKRIF